MKIVTGFSFECNSNFDIPMINAAVFETPYGEMRIDRNTTNYSFEDGVLSMDWEQPYLLNIYDVGMDSMRSMDITLTSSFTNWAIWYGQIWEVIMMDKLKETLLEYFLDEFYCNCAEDYRAEQRDRILKEELADNNLSDVPIAFSQWSPGSMDIIKYYGLDAASFAIDEQWTADLKDLKLYLELDYKEPPAITYKFTSPQEMTDFINSRQAWGSMLDDLIAEADSYINDNLDEVMAKYA